MNPFLDYFLNAVSLGMTFLFGCTGEIITEKVGHLNLGIPGIMSVGGACGCIALKLMYGSSVPAVLILIISMLVSFLGGLLMGMIYSFLTVSLKANQNVTGLAMTTFGVGVTKFIMSEFSVKNAHQFLYALEYFRFPFTKNETALKYWGVMLYLAIIIALTTSFVLSRTRVGLHLRAVGENPAAADAVGINVTLYKYSSTCIGSGIAALGGLYYIMNYMGSAEAYKRIESLGWLAVALVIFSLWKPHLSIIASTLFGMLYIAGTRLPTLLGIKIGTSAIYLFQMLPYVVTIVVLIISSIRNKKENQPPAALGVPYFREER